MGYILKKDQQDLVNLAKDFAEKKVAPFVHELDQAKEPGQKLLDIYQEAVDMGFCGLEIPEEYGGPGPEYYTTAASPWARITTPSQRSMKNWPKSTPASLRLSPLPAWA